MPKPGPDAFPIQLFGDEVEIFDNHQWMCLNWSAETSPVHSDAKASRYLICVLPVHSYLMRCRGQKKLVNVTLQECLRIVVRSLNDLAESGIEAVTCVKGDWKLLVQALSSKFSASSNEICFKCCATKNLRLPYTDVAPSADWRSRQRDEDLWHDSFLVRAPLLCNILYISFNFSDVQSFEVINLNRSGLGPHVLGEPEDQGVGTWEFEIPPSSAMEADETEIEP